MINAAGSFSDILAHQCGVGLDYTLIPFKGVYYEVNSQLASKIKRSIYPVPDLKYPFLGVHFTKSVTGKVYIGPTAIPVLSPESYSFFQGISLRSLEIIKQTFWFFLKSSEFRNLAYREIPYYLKRNFYKECAKLIPHLDIKDIVPSTKKGIRAQLIHKKTNEFVTDFLVLNGKKSLHILNAVSPGFTSAPMFAKYLIEEKLNI